MEESDFVDAHDWISEVEVLQKKVNLKQNEVDCLEEKLDSEAKVSEVAEDS